jgi:hypothetical protein
MINESVFGKDMKGRGRKLRFDPDMSGGTRENYEEPQDSCVPMRYEPGTS